jgi:hypothetical protein
MTFPTNGTIVIPEEVLDEFLSGRCMDLAAAMHRKHGWEIQLQLYPENLIGHLDTVDSLLARLGEDKTQWPYIGHAWCVDSSGVCYDIEGGIVPDQFGWSPCMKNLDEASLLQVIQVSAQRHVSHSDWSEQIVQAAEVMEQYKSDTIAPPDGRREP